MVELNQAMKFSGHVRFKIIAVKENGYLNTSFTIVFDTKLKSIKKPSPDLRRGFKNLDPKYVV